jgi:hypothetical protein
MKLTLPDDSCEAILDLCNILHHKHDNLPMGDDSEGKELIALAYALDKYDCAPAARFVTSAWINRILNRNSLDLGVHTKLLPVAYLINDPVSFQIISKGLLLQPWVKRGTWSSGYLQMREEYDTGSMVPEEFYRK